VKIDLRSRSSSKGQFCELFEVTDWNREYCAGPEELTRALDNSPFVAAAYEGDRLVGVWRVVTDGVLHAMIYDMIVDPAFGDVGIGTRHLRRLVG